MPARELVATGTTEAVLAALVASPGRDQHGAALHRETGLSTGRIYPVLVRLEALQWLDSGWAEPTSHRLGWPRRRWYRLTEYGMAMARGSLASAGSSTARNIGRLRPAGEAT